MNTSFGVIRFEAPSSVSPERLGRRYGKEAGRWDRTLSRLDFHRAYRRLFRSVGFEGVSYFHPTLLDIGIGTAAAGLSLVETLRARGRQVDTLYGIDLSQEMLDKASAKLLSKDVRLEGSVADADALPYQDAFFDVVVAAHVLEHSGRPLKAMAEFDRVLKPGGSAIIMMTRCGPMTVSIQKRWAIQCARSRKLEAVMRDFGYDPVRVLPYPGSRICNLLSFCCVARKPKS